MKNHKQKPDESHLVSSFHHEPQPSRASMSSHVKRRGPMAIHEMMMASLETGRIGLQMFVFPMTVSLC